MPRFIDRTGLRYGKLVAVEKAGVNALHKVLWKCACDCGGTVVVPAGSLVTGNTTSCGCVVPNFKHGGWKNGSYNTWRAMLRRCNNPKDKDYCKYGAAGVTVCPAWHDYLTFAAAMGEPTGNETLDRIDTYGNYEPGNCRWASPTVQCRNIRVPKNSKSGHTGVLVMKTGWMAAVTAKRKRYYSKLYKTLEEAVAARKQLELLHWGRK